MAGLPNRKAADKPNTAPLSTETTNVNTRTVRSIPISSTRGSSAGAMRSQQPDRCPGKRHANHTARECEHDALGEQRASDAATARPERGTHRQFLLASFRTHQEQVGHVPAGDEQHDTDGRHENPEDLADVADDVIGERAHVRLQLQPREHRREQRDHPRHIGVGLGQRDVRLQPRERLEPEADAARRAGVQRHGQHDFGTGAQERERRGKHTDDFARPAIDRERLANDVLGATEPALPVAVRQHHSQRVSRRVVFGAEDPADHRLHPQEGQCGGAHLQCLDAFRIAAARDRHLGGIPRADGLERLLVLAIGEIGGGP